MLPPGFNIVGALLCLSLIKRRRKTGVTLLLFFILSLYLLSLPWLARGLVSSLEIYPPLSIPAAEQSEAQAIVVLGGGVYHAAPEYGADALAQGNLPRLRYAAHLVRATGLPLVVTGGRLVGEGVSEGELMRRFLEDELQVNVARVEYQALNTAENAKLTKEILDEMGLVKPIVVTDASHMARAVTSFERVGLGVIPAPVEYLGAQLARRGVLDWLPSITALGLSTTALYEYVGRAWYWVRY